MILSALTRIVDALTPEIEATLDPREINPPSAWVAGSRAGDLTLSNEPSSIVADVYLITRDAGTPEAISKLGEMLEVALAQLAAGGIGVAEIALDEAVTIPSGGGPLPAYRLSVNTYI